MSAITRATPVSRPGGWPSPVPCYSAPCMLRDIAMSPRCALSAPPGVARIRHCRLQEVSGGMKGILHASARARNPPQSPHGMLRSPRWHRAVRPAVGCRGNSALEPPRISRNRHAKRRLCAVDVLPLFRQQTAEVVLRGGADGFAARKAASAPSESFCTCPSK